MKYDLPRDITLHLIEDVNKIPQLALYLIPAIESAFKDSVSRQTPQEIVNEIISRMVDGDDKISLWIATKKKEFIGTACLELIDHNELKGTACAIKFLWAKRGFLFALRNEARTIIENWGKNRGAIMVYFFAKKNPKPYSRLIFKDYDIGPTLFYKEIA